MMINSTNQKKVILKMPRIRKDPETGRTIKKEPIEKYVVTPDKDFSCSAGLIKKEALKESSFEINGNQVKIFDASFIDLFRKIKRGAQIMTIKDLGHIASYTCINRESNVLDSGSGSGSSACFFANITLNVDSFDVSKTNLEISRKNAESLGLKNVSFKEQNIYEYFPEQKENYDLFVLDVPEPWNAIQTAIHNLKIGGYLVVYAPNINQIHKVVNSLPEDLLYEKTIEIIEREWNVSELVLRPATKDFSHTAFLCFIRKIPK